MATKSDIPPLIVILGETATGKSALAIALAEKFDGEIISADSWTVYKEFDIGTAKPTQEDRAKILHHLIDVAEPIEGFSAAVFKRMAEEDMADIAARGKLPILVGGTGLYIDSVLYDYSFLPPSDPKQRRQLERMDLDALIAQAEAKGLDTSGIDLRNKRRVIRLIENNGLRPTKGPLRPNTLILGLQRPLDDLRQRILSRVESMVADGFVDEVRKLGEKYGWDIEPMRAPGYRAFAEYAAGRITLEAAKRRFVQNDLQLAKKQRTWFKRNKSIHWVTKQSEAVDLVTTFLNN